MKSNTTASAIMMAITAPSFSIPFLRISFSPRPMGACPIATGEKIGPKRRRFPSARQRRSRAHQVSEVKRFTLTGNFFPLVRREGIWTGFFLFHSPQVIGPSGVSMTSSSMGISRSSSCLPSGL